MSVNAKRAVVATKGAVTGLPVLENNPRKAAVLDLFAISKLAKTGYSANSALLDGVALAQSCLAVGLYS